MQVTLTNEQHGQFVHDLEEAEESLTNAQTVLSNLTIDVDDLKQGGQLFYTETMSFEAKIETYDNGKLIQEELLLESE